MSCHQSGGQVEVEGVERGYLSGLTTPALDTARPTGTPAVAQQPTSIATRGNVVCNVRTDTRVGQGRGEGTLRAKLIKSFLRGTDSESPN